MNIPLDLEFVLSFLTSVLKNGKGGRGGGRERRDGKERNNAEKNKQQKNAWGGWGVRQKSADFVVSPWVVNVTCV